MPVGKSNEWLREMLGSGDGYGYDHGVTRVAPRVWLGQSPVAAELEALQHG